jgi:hypothetical protein
MLRLGISPGRGDHPSLRDRLVGPCITPAAKTWTVRVFRVLPPNGVDDAGDLSEDQGGRDIRTGILTEAAGVSRRGAQGPSTQLLTR